MNTNEFYSLLLTENGIVDTVISVTPTSDVVGWGGQMVISPNGLLITYVITSTFPGVGKALLLDFDPSTGIVSNERELVDGGVLYGASFSPDGSKLYFSRTGQGELFQFDLNAGSLADIIASKFYLFWFQPDSWRQHQIGPDGKIYISRTMKPTLSMIEFPNIQGIGCNYIDSATYLGGKLTSHGLPNIVTAYNYDNGHSFCPTTGIIDRPDLGLNTITPNPIIDVGRINIDEPFVGPFVFELFDTQGRLVYRNDHMMDGGLLYKSDIPKGLLLYKIFKKDSLISLGKLLVQ